MLQTITPKYQQAAKNLSACPILLSCCKFPVETRDRWNHVLAAIFPQEASKLEQMSTLLEWIEARLEQPSESQRLPVQPEAVPVEATELMQVKDALAAVLQRLDKLETVQAAPKAQKKEKPKAVQDEKAEEPKPKRTGGRATAPTPSSLQCNPGIGNILTRPLPLL